MRIITLFARHGTSKYPDADRALGALFARTLPATAHELVIVDNSLPPDHESHPAPGRTLIGASNRAWEFSSWDRGVAWLGPRIAGYDLVHLATSAFGALHAGYLERFNAGMLERLAGRRAAVGHIDFYDAPISVLGRDSRHWLRSAFIFLPPAELLRLGSLIGLEHPAALFSGDPAAPFRPDAPLSPRYRRYILGWLTGAGTGQGTEWHSRFMLSAATLPFFEAKTTAILNEHLLSIRLREQGCALVDATWLDSRHRRLGTAPLKPLPSWERQLAGRDQGAVRPPSALRRLLYQRP